MDLADAAPFRFVVATSRPSVIPVGRPRGAKLAGLRYERTLAKALPAAKHGQWFQYMDSTGRVRYCQTDLLLSWGGDLLVLECKYTWTLEGHRQLETLYVPILRHLCGLRHVAGFVVAKRLTDEVRRSRIVVTGDLTVAAKAAREGHRVCWHWLGASVPEVLGPQTRSAA